MVVLSSDAREVIQAPCQRLATVRGTPRSLAKAPAVPPAPCRDRHRWRLRIIARRLVATLLILCNAQASIAAAGEPPPAPAASSPPEPENAIRLFAALRGAVEALDASSLDEPADRRGRLVASAVTLRLDGRVVGRGHDAADDGATLRRAAAAAIAEARERLPVGNSAVAEAQRKALASRLAISLELAGDLVPISPTTYAEADQTVLRGIEGVGVRIGDVVRIVSPATMLVNGMSPGDALVAAISAASGDPLLAVRTDPRAQPPAIAAAKAATFYKFHVAHLAQLDSGGQPTFLFRGGKVVAQRDITVESLRRQADAHVDWLLRWDSVRRSASPDWPRGAYLPSRDAFEPADASLAEFAVATYAIHRFIAVKAKFQAGADPWRIVRPGADAAAPLRFGPRRLEQQPLANVDAGPMFGCLHALVAMSPYEHAPIEPGATPPEVAAQDASLAMLYSASAGWSEQVPPNTRAFAAFVLARRATLVPGEPGRDERMAVARAATRSIFRETRPELLVKHMPWLGWSELLLAGDGEVPAAPALRDMRDLIWKFQMTDEDAGEEGPDLVGGIVFTSSAELLPTSQSLRPLAFVSTMAGDLRLTDAHERPMQVARMLRSLRFVRQLAMDESACHAAANPSMAMWGVRASLWDMRQSPEATSLALLTVCNALESLEAIASAKPSANP
jgi:hypothetical protein